MAICLSFLPLWHQGQRVKLFSSSSPWLCARNSNTWERYQLWSLCICACYHLTMLSNQASCEKILWTCAPLINYLCYVLMLKKQKTLCICNLLRSVVHLQFCACQRCLELLSPYQDDPKDLVRGTNLELSQNHLCSLYDSRFVFLLAVTYADI